MLLNYFKIAWRNLFKNKAFSFINISGLAIGMAATLLILLWVYNEQSWDKFHKNYSTVYHALSNRNFNGEITTGPDMMYPLARAAKSAFPEVEYATIVSFGETTLFSVGDKRLNKNTITVSPDFFQVFSFEFLQGSPASVTDPDAVILTESTARALFGNSHVVGEAVEVNNNRTAYVKAVIKDVPGTSTLQFDGIKPFNPSEPYIKEAEEDWVNCNNRVFLKTHAGGDISALEKKVHQMIRERSASENPTTRGSVILHPMSKWRLYSDFEDGQNVGGRVEYVRLFTWIAIIILVIACVNFMNLSTARSEKRAKEVGIRKTLGSERIQLLWQFIGESLLLSLIAFVLAVGILYAVLPAFSTLLNTTIEIPYRDPGTWILALSMIVLTGFLAGSYPAFYLSGFSPVKVLKGTFLPGKQGMLPRKVLVTSQFIVSIIFISATLIVYQQLQYVKNRDIGYDPDNLIMVNSSADTDKNFEALSNDLLQTGMVQSVVRTSSPLTTIYGFTSGVRWAGAPESNNLVIGFLAADKDFAKTLGARMLEGRDFQAGDSNKVIFNKEAIQVMGLKEPLGKEVTWAGRTLTIAGIVDNIIMTSPYDPPQPLMITYGNRRSGRINIRLAPTANVHTAMASIENIYKKYSIEYPFEFQFIDEAFNQKFINEQLIGKLSGIFSGLAIFICCLGLFGLVASSIERRTKEIGIRKVLGASLQSLLLLIAREFLWLVGIAFLVAIPLAWWAMHQWLQNFTYRTSIHISLFAVVGGITAIIALITISLNASGAALSNPVKTLRTE